MLSWLDSLLDVALSRRRAQGLPPPCLDDSDPCTRPAAYKGWVLPMRLLLAMHYVRRKRQLLLSWQQAAQIPNIQFATALLTRIGGRERATSPRLPWILRPAILSSVLIVAVGCALGVSAWRGQRQRMRQELERALSDSMVRFADYQHQVQSQKQYMKMQEATSKLGELFKSDADLRAEIDALTALLHSWNPQALATQQAARTLDPLRRYPDAHQALSAALQSVSMEELSADQIISQFAVANRKLHEAGLAYYVVPSVLGGRCDSFLKMQDRLAVDAMNSGLRKLVEQFPFAAVVLPKEVFALASDKLCRTTMILPYQVRARVLYEHAGHRYPVYHLQRLGNFPRTETTLGLTYHNGEGSQLHLDRIRSYAIESVLPSLTARGHSLMFPSMRSGMPIEEDSAEAVVRSLTLLYDGALSTLTAYADELVGYEETADKARLHQALMGLGHRVRASGEASLLSFSIDVLMSPEQELLHQTEEAGGGPRPEPAAPAEPVDEELKRDQARAEQLRAHPPAALARLEERLSEAIARHEVQHQISDHDKTTGECTKMASWARVRSQIAAEPGDLRPDLDGVCDEVAAYLVELQAAPQIRHIVLTQLASFALNPIADGTREALAGQVILYALNALRCREQPDAMNCPAADVPSTFPGPLAIAEAFRKARLLSDDTLGLYAEHAYKALLGHPFPQIRRLP